MIYLVVAGFAVVCIIAILWYARSAARQLAPLADAIVSMRRLKAQHIGYRPLRPGDRGIRDDAEAFDAATRELEQHGCVVLGDLVEEEADGTVAGVTRWFVDEHRTACGWFGVGRSAAGAIPAMMLFSQSAGVFVETMRGPTDIRVAEPPSIDRECLAWDEGLGRQLERHRTRSAASGDWLRVEGIDDAVALLLGLRDTVAQWRASQPPAELLAADLRSILRDRYEQLGSSLTVLIDSREKRSAAP